MRRLGGAFSLVLAFVALGCGSNTDNTFGNPDTDGGGGDGDLNSDSPWIGNQDATKQLLVITPANPVLTYNGAPVSQQFQAVLDNNTVATATWSLDNVAIGSIDANGLFTASGTAGGTATVTAQVGMATATTTVTVQLVITENPGNASQNVIAQLKGGGNSDGTYKWLYPYDKTVFPRGLTGPTMQFAGTPITYAWVHVTTKSKTLTYDGYYGGSSPARIDFSAPTWKMISKSAGANDTVTVQVTKLSGNAVTGPVTENWVIAQGDLKGTVYYNSYDSALAGQTGAVLKMKPGGVASVLTGGGGKCTVCHTVSSNGNVMLAANNTYTTGAKYDLKNNAAMSMTRSDKIYNFPAVYPDGTLAVSCTDDKIGGMWSGQQAHLYNVATGAQIAAPGLDNVISYAAMPAFSPDGKHLAFNNERTTAVQAPSQTNEIDTLDFDVNTKTFSNLKVQRKDADTSALLGWPAFTPTGKYVLLDHHITGFGQVNYGTWEGNLSKLEMVDTTNQTLYTLDLLNGYDQGKPYLPYGDDELRRNYEPNVLPLAVGGYVWVIFTSRRQYGNTINTANTSSDRKKLWVSAIDLNPTPGTDPSHPAFYLTGQELISGNMRGFWVLDPCKADGNSCTSGDECCGGYCRQINGDGGQQLVCVPPPGGCSHEFEKCNVKADCCDPAADCINGFCAQPPVN